MVSSHDDVILQFSELKKKFGDTELFKEFERKHSHDLDFLQFQKDNKLRYNKKTGKWNKPFIGNVKTVWITDKKNWNKDLKKFGYWANVFSGYQLVDNLADFKCKWCGKLLTNKQKSSCSDRHKTYYHRVLKRGKEICGFDINKNNHILLIPKVWYYEINENGSLETKQLREDDIKFKEVEFSVNAVRYPFTERSRSF